MEVKRNVEEHAVKNEREEICLLCTRAENGMSTGRSSLKVRVRRENHQARPTDQGYTGRPSAAGTFGMLTKECRVRGMILMATRLSKKLETKESQQFLNRKLQSLRRRFGAFWKVSVISQVSVTQRLSSAGQRQAQNHEVTYQPPGRGRREVASGHEETTWLRISTFTTDNKAWVESTGPNCGWQGQA